MSQCQKQSLVIGILLVIGTWTLAIRPSLCLLRFLVRRILFTPFAKFLERDLALHFADVFARPVVVALADRALQTNKIGLGHSMIFNSISQSQEPESNRRPYAYHAHALPTELSWQRLTRIFLNFVLLKCTVSTP